MEFLEKGTLPVSGLVIVPPLPRMLLPSDESFRRICVTAAQSPKHLLMQPDQPCPYPADWTRLVWPEGPG